MKIIPPLLLCCVIYSCLNAQPGALDKSFGVNGKVYTPYYNKQLNVIASAVQTDDKIVIAGTYYSSNKSGFFITRYLTKGDLDLNFGDSGKTVIDFGYNSYRAQAIAIQTDGKIIVTGYGSANTTNNTFDMLTVRLTATGKPDSSFGNRGKLITDFGTNEFSNAVCVQTDGKIILGGVYNSVECLLVRYKSNGVLDTSFGDEGKVVSAISPITGISSVIVQPDKKIIAGGSDDYPKSVFLISRYKPNGYIDSSFGSNGFVHTQVSTHGDFSTKILLQSDGKIIAAGRTGTDNMSDTNKDMVAVRYKTGGTLDKTYGNGGITTVSLNSSYLEANSAAMQSDGKLILIGEGGPVSGPADFCVARLTVDGKLDSLFGNKGIRFTNIKFHDIAYGGGIQNNNDIIATGISTTNNINNSGISLAAYYGGDTTFASSSKSYIVNIYPNPASNQLHIEGLLSERTKITVVDPAGCVKLHVVVNTASYSLNIASLKAGYYLLNFDMNGKVVTKQFVKL